MPKPFNDKVLSSLQNRADIFGWRMMQLQPFHMTHQECLDLICPKHVHNLLWTAAEVADVRNDTMDMAIEIPCTIDGVYYPKVDLKMRTHEGKEPPLRPRAPVWGSCDAHIKEKITAWTHHHLVVGRQTATVRWVLERLQEICDTGYQVRYLWPAILHLCAKADESDVHKWVDKFGTRTPVRHLPHISPEFRKILGDTSEWCAKAVLLADIPTMEQHEVVISHHTRYDFTIELGGDKVVLCRASV